MKFKKKATKIHSYTGADISKIILDYPRKYSKSENLKEFHFLELDISREGWSSMFPKRFDLIILSEVIEHLSRDRQKTVLQEIKNVLNPSGLLIVTCPNRLCFIKRTIKILQKISFFTRIFPILKTFQGLKGHVSELSFSELDKLAKDFKIIEHKGLTFSYGHEFLDRNSFNFSIFLALTSFFTLLFPSLCFDQYIILKLK